MKKILIMVTACLLLFSGCTDNTATEETTGASSASTEIFAMDTFMEITAYGEKATEAVAAAEDEVHRLDKLLSTGSSSSEITNINNNGGGTLSEDTGTIVKAAIDYYNLTEGSFDITVYPLMKAWGFTDKNYRVPSQEELDSLLQITGSDKLHYNESTRELSFDSEGMAIDLGGIAKGFASSRLMEIFFEYDIESALVSLGGNVHAYNSKIDGSPWRVGVKNPEDTSSIIGVLSISDKAVITSGGYERYFEENGSVYHHILDPTFGTPANNGLISVTIVSEDGMLADALSTALFVMGTEDATSFWRANSELFDAVFVTEDGSIQITSGLEKYFEAEIDYEIIF